MSEAVLYARPVRPAPVVLELFWMKTLTDWLVAPATMLSFAILLCHRDRNEDLVATLPDAFAQPAARLVADRVLEERSAHAQAVHVRLKKEDAAARQRDGQRDASCRDLKGVAVAIVLTTEKQNRTGPIGNGRIHPAATE